MKKTFAALAVLAALGSSAYAADVQLYGRADLGLRYTNVDRDLPGVDDQSTFEMASGNKTGSRFGLKGTEDLGNGYTVGFVLENGFAADSGSFDSNGSRMFGREATVQVKGPFGTLAMGRTAIMTSDSGSFGIGAGFSALGTGWGDVGGQNAVWGAGFSTRYDNMVTYVTPEFMGTSVYAQYSFGDASKGEEGKASTDRYYGIGINSNIGNLNLVGVVDSVNRASNGADATNDKDVWRVVVGGSYDFGVVKPYLAAAYFKDGAITDVASMYTYSTEAEAYAGGLKWNYDGWAVMLGASAPLAGGTLYGTAGYMSAEYQDDGQGNSAGQNDIDRWMVGVGYEYPLSKRTVVYVDAGYTQDSVDASGSAYDSDPRAVQAAFGMVHYF